MWPVDGQCDRSFHNYIAFVSSNIYLKSSITLDTNWDVFIFVNISPKYAFAPRRLWWFWACFERKKIKNAFLDVFAQNQWLKTFFWRNLSNSGIFRKNMVWHASFCPFLWKKKKHVKKKNIITCLQSLFNVVQAFKFV